CRRDTAARPALYTSGIQPPEARPMELRLADRPVLDLESDVLVVPELEADELSDLGRAIDARLGGRLARARALKDLSGKHAETFWLYSEGSVPAPRVLVVGIGKRDELTP